MINITHYSWRQQILSSIGLTAMLLALGSYRAMANPTEGIVRAGSAQISTSENRVDIYQQSDKAVIDWRSFDIVAGEVTEFHQPSSRAVALNRVVSQDPSHILGSLNANGRVALINQNGVIFGEGAKVDVGSLTVSTADVDTDVFMSDEAAPFNKAGAGDAKIINRGQITAKQAGLVTLIAPQVHNEGVITAELGKIQVAAGEVATLDLAGDGLIKIAIPADGLSSSRLEVQNSGIIKSDGGHVLITATDARGLVDSLISNTGSGIVQADTVGSKRGSVDIQAQFSTDENAHRATVENRGVIKAEGLENNERGGDITLSAQQIGMMAEASVSSTGKTGGGNIRIGGNYQGTGTMPHAKAIYVDSSASINSSSLQDGDAGQVILWSDEVTRFYGRILSEGGTKAGNGGFVEVSSAGWLDFNGFVSTYASNGLSGELLLDPTDITISAAASSNVTGASPYSPTADDVTSNINATTLLGVLATSSVTVATRATGTQSGNLIVSAPLTWTSGRTLTLDGHNDVIINAAITGGGLTIQAGNDIAINADLTGNAAGALTLQPRTSAISMGVGTGQAGTLNISDSEIAHIKTGWTNQIYFGRTDSTQPLNVGPYVWPLNTGPIRFRSNSGQISVNGTLNVTNNSLVFETNADLAINANISGTSSFVVRTNVGNTSLGLAGGTGNVMLTTAELNRLQNGFSGIQFGTNAGTAMPIEIGAYTWSDPVLIYANDGVITVNGTQNMGANSLTLISNVSPAINADLIGSGNFFFYPFTASTSMGVAGGAGAASLSAAALDHLLDGWTTMYFGVSTYSGTMNVGAYTWRDPVYFRSNTGEININGTQTMGANSLTFETNGDPVIAGNLTGSTTLTFRGISNATTIGVAGGAGTLGLTAGELAYITDGWANIIFGNSTTTGAINVGAASWNDNVVFRANTGILTISGQQTMNGGSHLFVQTDSDPVISANLVGSSTSNLYFYGPTASTSIGYGGGAGTLNVSTAELGFISNGWANIVFGGTGTTGAITANAATWSDNLLLRTSSGVITINGTQNAGANSITIQSDADPVINANLTGTGSLYFYGLNDATTIGIAGAAGAFAVSSAELARITNGWSRIYVGATTTTGAITAGSATWNDNLVLRSNTGVISLTGAQTMGGNSLVIVTAADPVISANISGSSSFSLVPISSAHTMAIGSTATGTIKLDDTELSYLQNGFSSLEFGYDPNNGSMPSALSVSAYTWNDTANFYTHGTLTVSGAQNAGSNNMSLLGNGMAINAAVNGTGTLTMRPISDIPINLADGSATTNFSLSTAELDNIGSGWGTISIGYHLWTNPVDLRAYTWRSNVAFNLGSSVLTVNGTQNFGSKNLTVNANSNPVINAALTGSGVLTFAPNSNVTNSTTIGLAGGAGTLNLSSTELAYITNGWSSLYFGSTSMTGALTVNSATWQDQVTFATSTGVLSINGAQSLGANRMNIRASSDPNIAASITTTDRVVVYANSGAGTMCVACTTGVVNLSNTELSLLSYSVFSAESANNALEVGSRTWGSGTEQFVAGSTITFNGANNFGAGNVLFYGANDIRFLAPVSGSGQLSFLPNGNGTSLSIGVTGSGLELLTSDIANIANGWSTISFNMNVAAVTQGITFGGSNTWSDPVRIDTYGTNQPITLGGTQNFGTNSLTIYADSDVAVTGSLSGSGALVIQPKTAATTMSVGGAGTIDLSTSDISGLVNGWSSITLGSTSATSNMNIGASNWTDPVTFLTQGNILLNGALSSTQTGTGTVLTLASTLGNFINSGGGISPGTGRYLIYSTNPSADTLGALSADFRRFSCTYGGGCPSLASSGNGFLYRYTPNLTVSVVDPAFIYGSTPGSYSFTYSGYLGGDATADTISGTGIVNSNYAVTANAGSAYSLTYASGLSSAMGYSLSAGAATVGTVAKAIVTAQVANASRVYGSANPTFAVNYTGFIGGQTESAIDTLATVSTAATSASSVGSYILAAAGAADTNYDFTYVDGTLSITKAPLVVQAIDATRRFGQDNPAFAVGYTGFVLGEGEGVIDTLATASTIARRRSSPGQYLITVSGAADNNYSFSYVNGRLIIEGVSPDQVPSSAAAVVSGGADILFKDWVRHADLSGKPVITPVIDFDRFGLSYLLSYLGFEIRPELLDIFDLRRWLEQEQKQRQILQ